MLLFKLFHQLQKLMWLKQVDECIVPFVLLNSLVYTQESPRMRVGLTEDGPGQIQEVKAIQQTRRLLANARERTRVHTISAAFEALRKQVRVLCWDLNITSLRACTLKTQLTVMNVPVMDINLASSDRALTVRVEHLIQKAHQSLCAPQRQ